MALGSVLLLGLSAACGGSTGDEPEDTGGVGGQSSSSSADVRKDDESREWIEGRNWPEPNAEEQRTAIERYGSEPSTFFDPETEEWVEETEEDHATCLIYNAIPAPVFDAECDAPINDELYLSTAGTFTVTEVEEDTIDGVGDVIRVGFRFASDDPEHLGCYAWGDYLQERGETGFDWIYTANCTPRPAVGDEFAGSYDVPTFLYADQIAIPTLAHCSID